MGKRKKTLYELGCEAMDAAAAFGMAAGTFDATGTVTGQPQPVLEAVMNVQKAAYRKARQTFVAAMDEQQNKEDARG